MLIIHSFLLFQQVKAQPACNKLLYQKDTLICPGASVTLSLMDTLTLAKSYSWSTGDTTASIIVSPVATTLYKVTRTSAGTLCSDSILIQLAPLVLDFKVIVQKDTICSGDADSLFVVSPQAGVIYAWYLPGSSIKINTGTFYGLTNLKKNSIYVINATGSAASCASKSTTAQIAVRPKLAKPIIRTDSIAVSSIIFSWNSVPGAMGYLVSLDNGATYTNPLSGPTGLTETITGIAAGQSQKIIVRATGLLACETSDTSQLTASTINPFGNGIYIPNAFTPNGDGTNDMFLVYGTAIKIMQLKIYNQWGGLVFESYDIAKGWDGMYHGNNASAGVYTYTLEAKMQDGKQVVKRGSLTLIR